MGGNQQEGDDMTPYTTLRLKNKFGEIACSWYAKVVEPKHYQELRTYQTLEPEMDWRLQTRGLSTDWHDYIPTMAAFGCNVIGEI